MKITKKEQKKNNKKGTRLRTMTLELEELKIFYLPIMLKTAVVKSSNLNKACRPQTNKFLRIVRTTYR